MSLPSNLSFQLSNLDLIEQEVLFPRYQQFLQTHQSHLPDLSAEDAKIVEGLEKQGMYITTLEALQIPGTQALLQEGHRVANELAQRSLSPLYINQHTLTATTEQLLHYPAIFWWGTAERLLSIAEAYLRLPVAYDGLSLYYSVADERDAGPRKWHRDKEDWRMIKVCVYLNDVDENGGPYELVKPDVNEYLVSTLLPKYRILTHQQMKDYLHCQTSDWKTTCTGRAGTVVFTDTARYYHRGKPPSHRDRKAIFFSYFSQRPKNPFFCGRSPLSDDHLAQLAASLPPHQQQSITWKRRLPGLGRYIPKNRVKV